MPQQMSMIAPTSLILQLYLTLTLPQKPIIQAVQFIAIMIPT